MRGGTDWTKMIQRLKGMPFQMFVTGLHQQSILEQKHDTACSNGAGVRPQDSDTYVRVAPDTYFPDTYENRYLEAPYAYFRVANRHDENALSASRALTPV